MKKQQIEVLQQVIDTVRELNTSGQLLKAMDDPKNQERIDYIAHVLLHRNAFCFLESKTPYVQKFSEYHDFDKIACAFVLGVEETKKLHKQIAPHHNIDWKHPDKLLLIEKAIDWECSHYTKLHRTESAYEYLLHYHPDKKDIMKPILKELGYWKKPHDYELLEYHYECMVHEITDMDYYKAILKSAEYLDAWIHSRIQTMELEEEEELEL